MQISRRAALSQFLRSRRAAIAPAALGLPERPRRRTPGLRREDVAALSGLSLTWYTRLEQGQEVRVSAEVLERIAATLRLSSIEREYLFELAHDRPAPVTRSDLDPVTPAMRRMLNALPMPAYITTMRWDVVAWNPLCARVLRDYGAMPARSRNLMKILFGGDTYGADPDEYRAMARRLVGKLRVDYSQFPGDPGLEALVGELSETYPLFRELWAIPELKGRSEGVGVIPHAQVGRIALEHSSYMPEGSPTLRVVIFAPHDGESAKKLEALAADL